MKKKMKKKVREECGRVERSEGRKVDVRKNEVGLKR